MAVQIGSALVVVPFACLVLQTFWASTRIWEPLDVPVSLSKATFKSAQFRVNVASNYSIAIEVNPNSGLERVRCPDGSEYCQISVSLLKASWTLWRDDKVVASHTSEPERFGLWQVQAVRVLGSFKATPGNYRLVLNVLEDESRLNSYDPHLVLYEDQGGYIRSSDQGYYVFLGFLLFAPVGLFTIILSAIARREEKLMALGTWSVTRPNPVKTGDIDPPE